MSILNLKLNRSGLIVILFMTAAFGLHAQDWQMKQANLMTEFANDVNPQNVLPEYPRPQLVREKWLNLNGLWQFQAANSRTEPLPAGNLSRQILVPFPVESAISGVMERHNAIWYNRAFTVPSDWSGQRIILHFGAVDWESEVFVNGTSVTLHRGGYDPFSIDITNYLNGTGPQELAVRVYDPTNDGGYARGKQSKTSYGIMYTSATGIWQTVWLEPLPSQSISSLKLIPDIDAGRLNVTVNVNNANNVTVQAVAYDNGVEVASITGSPNSHLQLPVSNPKLWSPASPKLYDLKVYLKQGNVVIDEVDSYFGMRKIALEEVDGVKKLMLNNEFVFQFGPLDQGFWPDGVYTAPTDEALRSDLEQMKAMGFNMVRKHIKVEPMRWYYWADKLGLMVWQDMPSVNSYIWPFYPEQPIDRPQFKAELERMVTGLISVPSIITWVVFNEEQGQHDAVELTHFVEQLDPSRVVNPASGSGWVDAGDMVDVHPYPAPVINGLENRDDVAKVIGEYGGIGLRVDGHYWSDDADSYVVVNSPQELIDMYAGFANTLKSHIINYGLSAAVYTEITDVENEINGMLTYDRIMKVPAESIRQINEEVIKIKGVEALLPNSGKVPQTWKYTTSQPGTGWMNEGFNDQSWTSSLGGFGGGGVPNANVQTSWTSSDIWLRKQFHVGNLSDDQLNSLKFSLFHDEACEIYINGVQAASVMGFTTSYEEVAISQNALNALRENDMNTIAIHCHQTYGGQFIDAGIVYIAYQDDQYSNNLALNQPTTVSSTINGYFPAFFAVDGNKGSRWGSVYSNPQWIYVDLGQEYDISRVKVFWEFARATDYQIQVSNDASNWTTIKTISGNTEEENDHIGLSGHGRYVRIYGTKAATMWGYSIYELEVYGPATSNIQARLGEETSESIDDHSPYPNPFKEEIILPLQIKSAAKVKITVANVAGQEIDTFSYHLKEGSHKIDLTEKLRPLDKGIFFLKVQMGKESHQFKIIKN
ncbi:galactose-binding domain-containing protein [Fulvivirga ligni]|uniref:galactose-binding domain-containing protein n=1 Tax=Fulvivirga ligni TaxID=2904246 RepID=UPI001F48ECBA|nr:discoidin domain-containing protein [Fulvivirga ligni]UII19549.1 discoidin domain-containing protein [Fulvivirga ligni]